MMTDLLPQGYPVRKEQGEAFTRDSNRLMIDEIGLLCSLLHEYRRKLNPACTERFLAELTKIDALNKKLNGLLVQALTDEQKNI